MNQHTESRVKQKLCAECLSMRVFFLLFLRLIFLEMAIECRDVVLQLRLYLKHHMSIVLHLVLRLNACIVLHLVLRLNACIVWEQFERAVRR